MRGIKGSGGLWLPANLVAVWTKLKDSEFRVAVAFRLLMAGMEQWTGLLSELSAVCGIKRRETLREAIRTLENHELLATRSQRGLHSEYRWMEALPPESEGGPPPSLPPETAGSPPPAPTPESEGGPPPESGGGKSPPSSPPTTPSCNPLSPPTEGNAPVGAFGDCLFQRPTTQVPDTRKFLNWWSTKFQELTGEKYAVLWGKDSKLIKNLLGVHGFEKLKLLATQFLEDPDDFACKAGRTIGVFCSQINKLVSQVPEGNDEGSSESAYRAYMDTVERKARAKSDHAEPGEVATPRPGS